MHKDTAIAIIKRKLGQKYETQDEMAEALGVARQSLNKALNNHLDPIPDYLLEFAGLTVTTKHIYGSKK